MAFRLPPFRKGVLTPEQSQKISVVSALVALTGRSTLTGFIGQLSPFLPCREQLSFKIYLWRTIMGIPMGFISQRTIRVDAVSRYHRLLGDLVCLDQADLLLPFPI